jgi:hypothetical protein
MEGALKSLRSPSSYSFRSSASLASLAEYRASEGLASTLGSTTVDGRLLEFQTLGVCAHTPE